MVKTGTFTTSVKATEL